MRPRIPELPTTTTSASAAPRGREDHRRDVLAGLDHGAGADPLGGQGALERLAARAARARPGPVAALGRRRDASASSSGATVRAPGRPTTWIASSSASSERAKVAAHSTASAAPALPSVATATSFVSAGTERA